MSSQKPKRYQLVMVFGITAASYLADTLGRCLVRSGFVLRMNAYQQEPALRNSAAHNLHHNLQGVV
jgi:hypothetical protein